MNTIKTTLILTKGHFRPNHFDIYFNITNTNIHSTNKRFFVRHKLIAFFEYLDKPVNQALFSRIKFLIRLQLKIATSGNNLVGGSQFTSYENHFSFYAD